MRERLPLKLMRLSQDTQEGFVMTDFPSSVGQAEMMEEFKGGLNAFIHLSMDDWAVRQLYECRYKCEESGRRYYSEDIVDP